MAKPYGVSPQNLAFCIFSKIANELTCHSLLEAQHFQQTIEFYFIYDPKR
jgi:hypothetical protein